jgi:hypothetical protein
MANLVGVRASLCEPPPSADISVEKGTVMTILRPLLAMALALGGAGCAASPAAEDPGGEGTVTIVDKTFKVNHIKFSHALGEGGFFRVEGDDAAHPDQDCLSGLSGGIALYGDLPADVTAIADLNGRELPFEFSGDGDDRNLCFVGSNGLLGVERGTVRFTVAGNKVSFTFSGSFIVYDGSGGRGPTEIAASGSGVAHVDTR